MSAIEKLAREFCDKYASEVICSFEQIINEKIYAKKGNRINFDSLPDKDIKFIDSIENNFREYIDETETKRSHEFAILPPFVFKEFYQACPYLDGDKVKLATCLPIAYYNQKDFHWMQKNILKIIASNSFSDDFKIFNKGIISNIDYEEASKLALAFRVLWYENSIQYEYKKANKPMNSYSLISFQVLGPNRQKTWIWCLIDLGYKENTDKLDGFLFFSKILYKMYNGEINKENFNPEEFLLNI